MVLHGTLIRLLTRDVHELLLKSDKDYLKWLGWLSHP